MLKRAADIKAMIALRFTNEDAIIVKTEVMKMTT